ncbi:NUDIX hydrolase [Gorillibacterium sp. sgz5001074]|uniref:NUDIX hydrolase n=1 Tax=Gorillibacterium sp. sgz5001074 TaxID=3446695 RepID=UPI003F67E404
MKVRFYDIGSVEDAKLFYAVTAARYRGGWIWVRHKERVTWEMPGGRREPGEAILETARRELYEETGAVRYRQVPVCLYSVTPEGGAESFGGLFYAEVDELGDLPDSEIGEVAFFDGEPEALTYPQIQPFLLEKIRQAARPEPGESR